MHKTARDIGEMFLSTYWKPEFGRILDVGSMNVNGSLREFCPSGAEYTGIDLTRGAGVDMVLDDPYSFPFEDGRFDIIVSSSCFEHDQMFWLTFLECVRVLSPSGFLYINAPSSGPYHPYPFDIWRFYPDSGIALRNWARRMDMPLFIVESFMVRQIPGEFNDTVMIFCKSGEARPPRLISETLSYVVNIRAGDSSTLSNVVIAPTARVL